MWAISGSDHGIAVTSDVGSLKAAFPSERCISLDRVKYCDALDDKALADCLYFKRTSFAHERELRVSPAQPQFGAQTSGGIHLRVDLNKLVKKVWLNPKSARWLVEVVQQVVRKYDLDVAVEKSPLYNLK